MTTQSRCKELRLLRKDVKVTCQGEYLDGLRTKISFDSPIGRDPRNRKVTNFGGVASFHLSSTCSSATTDGDIRCNITKHKKPPH